ncbi:thiamine biosynthesis lipoprotein [Rheinheimera pacifica]|uniref:FAD:protein FMN transferase n=1 Tax=Rheinheimera pacifica TaxID=173990 RepID=A0A1H6LV75_9GAMM|nr:FAD:protein FMN transferase [Rheinheimera pacifica]SEH92618.1 thiamine biosynthesis lipoprotein [Rheinheimera pacifica]
MSRVSFLKNWLALIGLAILVSCSPSTPPTEQYQLNGNTMGTYYVVKFYTDAVVDKTALQHQIDTELELVNDLMSTYRPESELMRFNRHSDGSVFPLSPQTHTVVAEALRIAGQTQGVLDVTVGPLVELWGFGARGRIEHAPDDAIIQQTRAVVGFDKLALTAQGLQKANPELAVDLSPIAKGFGVDQVAAILEQNGITNYLVEIGGEMRLKGVKPEQQPWKIAIEKPVNNERAVQRILVPGDIGVATSGDYRNYFEENGIRYSHLLDPRTGKPINNRTVSVTVLHPSCMTADGYATALNVMDSQEALAFANQHGIAVLLVVKTDDGYTELSSEAFEPYLTQ